MRIRVPKEIKIHEYRVGLTADAVSELVARGHEVMVETGAGVGIDIPDGAYAAAGAAGRCLGRPGGAAPRPRAQPRMTRQPIWRKA